MNEFANLFSSKRVEKGLSQGEIASMLNVTRQAVSKWENGKAMPDITLMPQIAEILGVSIEELLTGNEPKKQVEVVEKIVVQEKEVVKPMPVRKIFAIVLPIVLVVVLASSLMGVFIPRAIARNTPPPVTETPEPEIQYTEVLIKGKSDTDDSRFQAPLINNKAYYGLKMQFSSDYTLYITAPKGAVVTFNTSEADYTVPDGVKTTSTVIAEFDTAKTVEYSLFFESDYFYYNDKQDRYILGGALIKWQSSVNVGDPAVLGELAYKNITHYSKYIVIDVSNCSEEDRIKAKQQIVVRQHMGFENITVPANSSYFTAIPISYEFGAKHYVIKSDGVQYVNTLNIAHDYSECSAVGQAIFNNLPISDFYVLGYQRVTFNGGEDGDFYIGLINETDTDIRLEIEEKPIEEIEIDQQVLFQSNNEKNHKTIYKLKVNKEMKLMFKFQYVPYTGNMFNMYDYYNMYSIYDYADGYESEWYQSGFYTLYYIKPGEYYIIVCSTSSQKDFLFEIVDWDEYWFNKPKN